MRRLGFVFVLPIAATVASCLGPTEIMLGITTNACSKLTRTDIYVGQSAFISQSGGCPDAHSTAIGALAITPSGSIDSTVDIVVVGALGAPCNGPSPTDSQCIVARRTLSFIPHQRLDLPVFLDSACAGTICPTGSTCVVDSTGPECVGAVCNSMGGVSCDGDGGPPPPVPDAAPPDAPDVCPPPIVNGVPTLSWSFDGASDQIYEDQKRTAPEPLVAGAISDSPPPYCGNYLAPSGYQPIAQAAPQLATRSFILAFAFRTMGDGTLLQLTSKYQNAGLSIGIDQGVVAIDFQTNVTNQVYRGTLNKADGNWHTIAVHVATAGAAPDGGGGGATSLKVSEDGATSAPVTTIAYVAASDILSAGPNGPIDQVAFFAE